MPKADRILANLPPTMRLRTDPSALRAVADAYGGELQTAENSLIATMRAHWGEFADAGESRITDLALLAALYGLAPRPDEGVEEFREHLFRHVRTMLDGSLTVRGILDVAAQTLGLHLEQALDAWWDRPDAVLVTSLPRGADAAPRVLGVPAASVVGSDAQPATLTGRVDLPAGVDLRGPHILLVALDGHGALPADLRTGAADPAAVTGAELVTALEAELGVPGVAELRDGRLVLVSPTAGQESAVVVEDGEDDAADLVLGLPARTRTGSGATSARISGTVDLGDGADLRQQRYLRLAVDGTHLAEVDCAAAAASPDAVDIADVTAAINAALGLPVASDDGRLLTLTSPTRGPGSSIALQEPAAQPATRRLLGDPPLLAVGAAAQPARLVSSRGIGLGVDLRAGSLLRIAVDEQPPVTIDVAGIDAASTTPAEIVAAVNEGLGAQAASHDGERLSLVSPTVGDAGVLRVEEPDGDASPAVLGLLPRSARGLLPVTASLTGPSDLSGGVDLSSRHLLAVRVDGGPLVEVDLRAGQGDPASVPVDAVVDALNAGLGDEVATTDGAHLILVSPTPGAGGALEVRPLVETVRRRFVTRARVTDDAATTLLGYASRVATGSDATSARLQGSEDLSGGADLEAARYLRVSIGGRPGVDVDCAGPRARATTPAEVVDRINAALGPVAATDGHVLVLADPVPGASSRVALEPPQALDALDEVLGLPPGEARGEAAGGVRVIGTVDLSAGVELPADAALRIGVDGAQPVDVQIGDGDEARVRSLSAIIAKIGFVLGGQVAASDGTHLVLTSPARGAASAVVLEVPSTGTDATAAVVGVAAPRSYAGRDATPARLVGAVDLTAGADLRTARLLRVAIDGGTPVDVDLAAGVPDGERPAVDIGRITAALRAATTVRATSEAIPGGTGVALASPTTGPGSRLQLSRPGAGDAAALLLGAAGAVAEGRAAAPAVVEGDVDLLGPVDLSARSVLRIAVDGGPPVDVDVAGVSPRATLLGEVVAALDEQLPGVAAASPTSRLQLRSPTTGPSSRVEVLTLRHLDLVEYPPTRAEASSAVSHGGALVLTNTGPAAVPVRVEVDTAGGVASPRIADPSQGWSVQVDAAVEAGGRLVMEAGEDGGVVATLTGSQGLIVLPTSLVDVRPAPGTSRAVSALTARPGRNRWTWTECDAARFDEAVFDSDAFAGGPCVEAAVFDLSRFSSSGVAPAGVVPARFAASATRSATARVTLSWDAHTAGAFEVHLPADLDARFGLPLGEHRSAGGVPEVRFGSAVPEAVLSVVTDPLEDDDHVLRRINLESRLVEASVVRTVPIGWRPVPVPFRDPVRLSLGAASAEARMYVSAPGLAPGFLEVRAAERGIYGNDIAVAVRLVGPERYDVEVHFPGSRFENARTVVLGPPLAALAGALVAPVPVGVTTAKAAGVRAAVCRARAAPPAVPSAASTLTPPRRPAPGRTSRR